MSYYLVLEELLLNIHYSHLDFLVLCAKMLTSAGSKYILDPPYHTMMGGQVGEAPPSSRTAQHALHIGIT